MNNKKLLVALAGALAVAATTYARPAPVHNNHGGRGPAPVHHVARPAGNHHVAHHRTPPPPPPPRHHHHKHHASGLDIAAGIVQTVANIFAPPPAPVVVAQPTVVATPAVVTTPAVITAPAVYQTW